jgi:hypothetical protein
MTDLVRAQSKNRPSFGLLTLPEGSVKLKILQRGINSRDGANDIRLFGYTTVISGTGDQHRRD